MAQLTSNNDRTRAHHFYERLGWAQSHAGFKLNLKGEGNAGTLFRRMAVGDRIVHQLAAR